MRLPRSDDELLEELHPNGLPRLVQQLPVNINDGHNVYNHYGNNHNFANVQVPRGNCGDRRRRVYSIHPNQMLRHKVAGGSGSRKASLHLPEYYDYGYDYDYGYGDN